MVKLTIVYKEKHMFYDVIDIPFIIHRERSIIKWISKCNILMNQSTY